MATQPTLVTGDITQSQSTVETDETPSVEHPDYVSGDFLAQFFMMDDDDPLTIPTTGVNGESLLFTGVQGAATTAGPTIAMIAWIGDATIGSGTRDWAIGGGGEGWVAYTIKKAAGTFGAATPIDSYSTSINSAGSGSDVPTPSWSAVAADGLVVVGCAIDGGDALTGVAANWTLVRADNPSTVGAGITIRDAATTALESIPSVNHTTVSDSSATLGFVLSGYAAGGGAAPQGIFDLYYRQLMAGNS